MLLGHSAGKFGGGTTLGATIVDGMDTLWMMGLTDKFNEGKEWIRDHLNFDLVCQYEVELLPISIIVDTCLLHQQWVNIFRGFFCRYRQLVLQTKTGLHMLYLFLGYKIINWFS